MAGGKKVCINPEVKVQKRKDHCRRVSVARSQLGTGICPEVTSGMGNALCIWEGY